MKKPATVLIALAATILPAVPSSLAAFPGANGSLVFASDRDGDLELFLSRADGSDPVQITENTATDFDASWSPDGRSLVFASDRDGDFEIFRMEIKGRAVTQLTNNTTTDLFPTWTPDGQTIVFSGGELQADLFTMARDGSNVTPLVTGPGNDVLAAVSPDGESVAFQSDRDGDGEIYLVPMAGGTPTQLTNNALGDFGASWHPRRRLLLFSSDRTGDMEIYLLDLREPAPSDARTVLGVLGESAAIRLTNSPGHDGDAVFAPNGLSILFDSERGGSIDIFRMPFSISETPPADDTTATQLTKEPGIDSGADQQPVNIDLEVELLGRRFIEEDVNEIYRLIAINNGRLPSDAEYSWRVRVGRREAEILGFEGPTRGDCDIDVRGRGRRRETWELECSVNNLKPGERVMVKFVFFSADPGVFEWEARISSDTPPDYRPANNHTESSIDVFGH